MGDSPGHRWRFFRAGGFDQVRIDTGADLLALRQLDQKLWVALACPTKGLHFDRRTLELMDEDKDGRIRAPEFIEAAEWVGRVLVDCSALPEEHAALRLSNIRADTSEGELFLQAAKAVLRSTGKPDAVELTVEEASKAVDAFNAAALNGDGIVTELSATSEATRKVITEAIECIGSSPDRSGKPGLSKEQISKFFAEARAHLAWRSRAEKEDGLRILGDATADARAALEAVQQKVDDYFARCRLAAFDPRAAPLLNGDEKTYAELAPKTLHPGMDEIAALPLAQVGPGRALPLTSSLNPAWADRVAAFSRACVEPLLGKRDALTDADWRELVAHFGAYDAWMKEKQGAAVERLGEARLRELTDGDAERLLVEIAEQDLALAPVAGSLASVEKLVRLHRDLYRLANNFVSFRDFYAQTERATFQAGTLYIDERSLELCVRVPDAGKHAELAGLSRMYLAYCECRRLDEKMMIAAAFTNGDSDNVMVGRNGVFYDREGKDWDATVVKIISNPISIRQAFFSPYKKLIRFVEELMARRAAAADERASTRLTSGATTADLAMDAGAVAPPQPRKIDIGTVAALGVAVGGITAALGALFGALLGLGWLMPLGVLAFILAISLPSMVIAWLKLRQRNLAALLDANGWAVNAPAKVNLPFGQTLTKLRRLPPGATLNLVDPYPKRRSPWWVWLLIALLVTLAMTWLSGRVDFLLPEPIRRDTVLGLGPTPEPIPAPTP